MIYLIALVLHLFGICTEDPSGQSDKCIICGKKVEKEDK